MENGHYAAYDATGRITTQVTCEVQLADLNMKSNTTDPYIRIISPVSVQEYYISNQALRLRPRSTAVIDGNLLKGVPAGASVTIESQVYTADGTDIELEFVHPGTYEIKVDAFPQVDWVGEYVEN